MSFFKRLFQKEKPKEIPAMPPWSEIVEMMKDKHLDDFADEVVRVVYSADKTQLPPKLTHTAAEAKKSG